VSQIIQIEERLQALETANAQFQSKNKKARK